MSASNNSVSGIENEEDFTVHAEQFVETDDNRSSTITVTAGGPDEELTPVQRAILDTLKDPDVPTLASDGDVAFSMPFNEATQLKYLTLFATHGPTMKRYVGTFKPYYFAQAHHQKMFEQLERLYRQYNTLPDLAVLKDEYKKALGEKADPEAMQAFGRFEFAIQTEAKKELGQSLDMLYDRLDDVIVRGQINSVWTKHHQKVKEESAQPDFSYRRLASSAINDVMKAIEFSSAWPDPLDLNKWAVSSSRPDFPIEAVKDVCPYFYDMCVACTHHFQTPVDLAATMALAVLSLGTAGRVEAKIRPSSNVPAVLWMLCGLPSGELKSPVKERLQKPVSVWLKEAKERAADEVRQDRSRRSADQKQLENYNRELSKLGDDDAAEVRRDDIIMRMSKIEARLEQPEKVSPELFVEDSTPEAVLEVMAQQNGKIAVFTDEAIFIEVAMGRYSGSANLELYLKGYGGQSYTVNRKGKPAVHLAATYLTQGMAVQPDVVTALVSDESEGRGFFPRYLACMPNSRLGTRDRKILTEFPADVEAGWGLTVRRLMNARDKRVLTPNFELVTDWEQKYEPLLGKDGELNAVSSWASKQIAGGMLRVAAVLHCASGNTSDNIPDETIRCAMKIIEYYLEHTKYIYGVARHDETIKLAAKIRDFIIQRGDATFNFTVVNKNPGKNVDKTALEAAYLNKFDTSTGNLICSGVIALTSEDDHVANLVRKMEAGVPYEASVEFGDDATLEYVPEGMSTQVNDRDVDGPVTVIRQWSLKAVAICKFGMDGGTSTDLLMSDAPKKKKEQKNGGYFIRLSKGKKIMNENANYEDVKKPEINPAVEADKVEAPKDEPKADEQKPVEDPKSVEPVKPVEDVKVEVEVKSEADEKKADDSETKKMSVEAEDPRKEFKMFVTEFGAERAADYFAKGLSMSQATSAYVKALKAENDELRARGNTAVGRGMSEPVKFSDGDGRNANQKVGMASVIRVHK